MHVMIVKEPRKPPKAVVIEKNTLQQARDIISTMEVMKPKWKCELIKAEKLQATDAFPTSVVKQAAIEPLQIQTNAGVIAALEALL
jgi:formylmethanofuran dehydrogenase subunit E-like metal-binding protein